MRPDRPSERWLHRFRPRPAASVRLVCFPHAGGSAVAFHPWTAAVDPAIEVLAVQYPGRQDRHAEPRVEDLDELADRVTGPLLDTLGPGARYAFFGHSMGAVLAFEVARRLEARDAGGPELLVVSGRRAPSEHRADEAAHLLDDGELAAHLHELSGTDARLLADAEARAMILPTVRGDLRAVETYRCPPDATVDAPILAITGDDDPWTTIPEAVAWSGHTRGGFELRVLPGGHFYLVEHQAEVLDLVAERLVLPDRERRTA
jgi:surfactin synthase thioesterase subunit